jgi:hypothetical protein
MAPLVIRSWKAHRTFIERLMGVEAVYVAEVTDGYRSVRARGPNEEATIEKAKRDWEKLVRPH